MTLADIQNKIYLYTKTNSTSFSNANMLIELNNALERIWSLILQADGRWQLDDANQTDFPIATAALVASQQDYTLAVSHLRITRVELKDSSGTWRQLTPYDQDDYIGSSLTQLATQTGVPIAYDVLGSSVLLWPVPNFSQASSLKIYFGRGPYAFTASDLSTGTLKPGFNSVYHDLIALWVAYNYNIVNDPPKAPGLYAEIERREVQIVRDYGSRNKDDPARMTMKGISFR